MFSFESEIVLVSACISEDLVLDIEGELDWLLVGSVIFVDSSIDSRSKVPRSHGY